MLAVMSFVAYSAAVLIGKGALKALFFVLQVVA